MARKCSKCGNMGHNSRTCNVQQKESVKLFGIRLDLNSSADPSLKKSFSADCLSSFSSSWSSIITTTTSSSTSNSVVSSTVGENNNNDNGFLSDELIGRTQERKKGVAWTAEEHQMFLLGLQKLGKGDWRGISRNFVSTRTPTQVASHSQKYFLRQNSVSNQKRRPSLFDMGCVQSPIYKANERELALKHKAAYSTKLGLRGHKPMLPTWLINKPSVNSEAEPACFAWTNRNGQRVAPDLELKLAALASSDQEVDDLLIGPHFRVK